MKKINSQNKWSALCAGFLIYLIGGFPTLLFAKPHGGEIKHGKGEIHEHEGHVEIHQHSPKLIINWQGFNVDVGESVQFFQPSISSVVLNRVVGVAPSVINGALSANGQVFITNPSGVTFGPSARVNVNGLLATTLKISDQDFIDSNYNFFQDSTRPLAAILNEGVIDAAAYAALLAPAVDNQGTIFANMGSVALASGTAATLDFTGDGLISFAVTGDVYGTVVDADGNVIKDRVNNAGFIRADGGLVTLTARDAGEIIRNVVNNTGVIEARTVFAKSGRIFLAGGDLGIVKVAGLLDASGKNTGETGGTVHVLGEEVALAKNAKMDVSGDAGGGTVLIGGDFHGLGTVPTAFRTTVDKHVSIKADALTNGDGGKVIVWADHETKFYGKISAKGGNESGDGGFVEVSGEKLKYKGKIDVSASNGEAGSVLFDPKNATIKDTVLADQIDLKGHDEFAEHAGSSVVFDADQITAITDTGANFALLVNNDLVIEEGIVSTGGGGMSFVAGRSVTVNADVVTSGGDVVVIANNGSGTPFPGTDESQRDPGPAQIQMANGVTINSGNGDTTLLLADGQLNSQTGNIVVANISAKDVSITNHGATPESGILSASGGSLITADSLSLNVENSGGGGSIGTLSNPLRVQVAHLDAVTHFGSPGIFLHAANPGQVLFLGGSAFAGGSHGLKTMVSGDIVLTSDGEIRTTTASTDNIYSAGTLTLQGAEGLKLDTVTFSVGAAVFDADWDDDGEGKFVTSDEVSTANAAITINGGELQIGKPLSSGTATMTITASSGVSMDLGDNNGADFVLDKSELQKITAGDLVVGGDRNKDLFVDNVTLADLATITGTMTLNSKTPGGIVNFLDKASTFKNSLTVNSGGPILVQTDLTVNGPLTLNANGGVLVNDIFNQPNPTTVVASGPININADTGNDGSGIFMVSGADIFSNGNPINIIANDIQLASSLNSGAAATTLVPVAAGTGVGLGTAATGVLFGINVAEFGGINAGTIIVGDSSTGSILVDGLNLGSTNLTLNSAGSINDLNDDGVDAIVTTAGLTLNGNGIGNLNGSEGLNIDAGQLNFTNGPSAGVTVTNTNLPGANVALGGTSGTGDVNYTQTNGNILLASLNSLGNVNLISAGNSQLISLNSQGNVNLDSGGNSQVTSLNAQGNVKLNSGGNILLASLTSQGNVNLDSGGTINDGGDLVDAIVTPNGLILNSGGHIGNLNGPEGLNVDVGGAISANATSGDIVLTNSNYFGTSVGFEAVALGSDITYTQTNGDIMLASITTPGNVVLNVPGGGIMDANGNTTGDNITANSAVLMAGTSIGVPNPLEIRTNVFPLVRASNVQGADTLFVQAFADALAESNNPCF